LIGRERDPSTPLRFAQGDKSYVLPTSHAAAVEGSFVAGGFDGGGAGFGAGDDLAGADGGFAVADIFEPGDGAVVAS